MESPLNLAHLQDRQAESFLRHGKFADAITCHEKASEYLLEAMKMTQVTQALVSMKLQYTSHLRQQRVLKDKWKRYELQIKTNEERTQKLKEQEFEGEMNCTLNQLNPSQASSLVISAENFSVSSISSCEESGKDECDSANASIRELQMQVLSLNQALEDSNRENAKLKRTIISIKEFVEKTFGYVLDEEKFLEEQIESSALKIPDDSRFENNDIDIDTGVQSSSAAVIDGNLSSAGDPHCHDVGNEVA